MQTPTPIETLNLIPIGPHPEDVAISAENVLYTGLADGRIVRIANHTEITDVANTGGRPLGLDWLPDGRLVVCDTQRGLLAVDVESGEIEVLVAKRHAALHVCNNPCVAADGRIFFSDSTQRHTEHEASKDIADGIATGRLLCRHPNGRVDVLLDDLLFANGTIIAPDQSFVLVAQTGRGCINRVWLTGDKAGETDLFVADMPGLPDNLAIGSDGLIWVALVSPFTKELRQILAAPRWLRYIVARLPERLQPAQPTICRVAAYDLSGNLVHLFEGDNERYFFVTGAREQNGRVYMGSFVNDAIAWFDLKSGS